MGGWLITRDYNESIYQKQFFVKFLIENSLKTGAATKLQKTETEDVPDKDVPPAPTDEEAVAAAAAGAAGAAAQPTPGALKEKDVKEVLEERIDLYKIDVDENELNLRRNTILGK